MTIEVLSDAQITNLSPAQRAELIARLEVAGRVPQPSPTLNRRIRRAPVGLLIPSTLALVPWTIFLATTLPPKYTAHNWRATWVGFDIILLVLLASTAILGLFRRRLVLMTAFATGVLLACDAWFDVMTASPSDRAESLASALIIELPFAAVLVAATLQLSRMALRNPRLFIQ